MYLSLNYLKECLPYTFLQFKTKSYFHAFIKCLHSSNEYLRTFGCEEEIFDNETVLWVDGWRLASALLKS